MGRGGQNLPEAVRGLHRARGLSTNPVSPFPQSGSRSPKPLPAKETRGRVRVPGPRPCPQGALGRRSAPTYARAGDVGASLCACTSWKSQHTGRSVLSDAKGSERRQRRLRQEPQPKVLLKLLGGVSTRKRKPRGRHRRAHVIGAHLAHEKPARMREGHRVEQRGSWDRR